MAELSSPKRATIALLLLIVAAGWSGTAAASLSAEPEVKAFIDQVSRRHGFERERLATLLDEAKILDSILEAISRPAEAKPWYQYRKIFLTPTRIDGGVKFWAEHAATLARAEKAYGVPAEVIVAIIGVETLYGTRKGNIRVLDALATLGFRYPRRAAFFRRELEQFLVLAQEEGLEPTSLSGSYAGAMGIPQFIPSSYRAYAVDFDNDRVRDLLNSTADAIGSVANYLAEHGWRAGEPIAAPVRVSGAAYRGLVDAGIKPHTSVAKMRALDVDDYDALPADASAALLEFELMDGAEYWVGLSNFYMITRYNHSQLYAMAVFQLADAIKQRRAAG